MMAERLQSTAIAAPHGFFTRRGGVSAGPYASLNCSLSSADDPECVQANRARVAASLGAAALVGLTQVHGITVAVVEAAWATGPRAVEEAWARGPRADAMVTRVPGLALGIVTADCAPVLFEDRAAGVVGAAHAGWRGAAEGVLEAVLSAMRGLGAEAITAVVGPCIAQRSYEVAADMRDGVLAGDPLAARFFVAGRPERWQFDLAGFCVARLEAGGAVASSLAVDTLADVDRFFSHRRRTLAGGGPIGHQMSAIAL